MAKYNINDPDVINTLQNFEWQELNNTGMKNLSGGFASAKIFNYDNDYFDVELKWGHQDDTQTVTHTEQYKIDRNTLEIRD